MKIRFHFLTVVFLLTRSVFNNVEAQSKFTPKLDLYILVGQSNMAGRAPLPSDGKNEGDSHVLMFTKDSQWVLAKHPLHFDKPKTVGAGPGLSFGIKMAKANRKAIIGLIPCAVGGTKIELWIPGAFDAVTNTHPYDDAEKRIKAAMKYGVIKGIIWHQGESNSNPVDALNYLDKLIVLINRLREVSNNNKVPLYSWRTWKVQAGLQ
ncbi:MAG: hypothetical protein JWN56_2001 [Sphingobacteriales bacterium]|nr:hypothetical protein [Sphingobacteriales bacterium]